MRVTKNVCRVKSFVIHSILVLRLSMDYLFSYNSPIDFFYSDSFAQLIFWIKIFSGLVTVALSIGIVVLGIKTKKFWSRIGEVKESIGAVSQIKEKGKMVQKWKDIVVKAESHIESDRKMAVIEADKLMDELIKRIGFKGKDMGERLKQINSSQISNINDIWQAHKIRNNLVHDAYFKLTENDTGYVIRVYGNTLEELGIL